MEGSLGKWENFTFILDQDFPIAFYFKTLPSNMSFVSVVFIFYFLFIYFSNTFACVI